MKKLKINNLNKKIFIWRKALIINSMLVLSLFAILSILNYKLVNDLKEIKFIDDICNNVVMYHVLAFLVMLFTYTLVFKFSNKTIPLWKILIIVLIANGYKYLIYLFNVQFLNVIIDFIYFPLSVYLCKGSWKKCIIILVLISIIQLLISCIRDYWLKDIISNHISLYFILNIDLFIIVYNFYKGGEEICGNVYYSGESHRGFIQLLVSFWASLKYHIISWLASSKTLRKVTKKEKKLKTNTKLDVLDFVYIALYIIWNAFTIWIVYRMAISNNKIVEMTILIVAFIINKSIFGRPLHLSADACFIISLIVFYILSKSIPGTSVSIIVPIMIGITLSMISNIIQELIFEDIKKSLRDKINDKTNGFNTKENILEICKSKNWTDNKSEEIAETVYNYLHNSQYETANIMCCDNRTVTRRINEFLKD